MLSAAEIVKSHAIKVQEWHLLLQLKEVNVPASLIEENHYWNYKLWHEEDIARITEIDPLEIVAAKRNIDLFNQQRNDAIEKIDDWLSDQLKAVCRAPDVSLHSESPGMMIDRLSILSLKKYHMDEEAQRQNATAYHREQCAEKSALLISQINDLAACLAVVLDRLENGLLHFKVYRHLKMYNDPSLNPSLYNPQKPSATDPC